MTGNLLFFGVRFPPGRQGRERDLEEITDRPGFPLLMSTSLSGVLFFQFSPPPPFRKPGRSSLKISRRRNRRKRRSLIRPIPPPPPLAFPLNLDLEDFLINIKVIWETARKNDKNVWNFLYESFRPPPKKNLPQKC